MHVEDSNGYIATDTYQPIPLVETADWNQLQFSSITVQSLTQTNDYGHYIGYQFYPFNRWGQGHFQETFTQHDQDLTNDDPGEDGSGTGYNNWLYTLAQPEQLLVVVPGRRAAGREGDGIVLWYFGSTHHEPTNADNQMGSGDRTGASPARRLGFEMVPHNFLTTTRWAGRRAAGTQGT